MDALGYALDHVEECSFIVNVIATDPNTITSTDNIVRRRTLSFRCRKHIPVRIRMRVKIDSKESRSKRTPCRGVRRQHLLQTVSTTGTIKRLESHSEYLVHLNATIYLNYYN
jgi:hypothetical protein